MKKIPKEHHLKETWLEKPAEENRPPAILHELIHPEKNEVAIPFNAATVTLVKGARTLRLKYHQAQEVIYVLQGKGLLWIGSEATVLQAGDTVHLLPQEERYLEGQGEEEFVYLSLLTPAHQPQDVIFLEEADIAPAPTRCSTC